MGVKKFYVMGGILIGLDFEKLGKVPFSDDR